MNDFSIEERLLRARGKLAALAFLFNSASSEFALTREASSGLGIILEEVAGELEPLQDAPMEVLNWSPGEAK